MAEIIAEFENMNSTKNATTTEPAPAAETTPDKENAEPQKLSKSQKKRLKEKEKKGISPFETDPALPTENSHSDKFVNTLNDRTKS